MALLVQGGVSSGGQLVFVSTHGVPACTGAGRKVTLLSFFPRGLPHGGFCPDPRLPGGGLGQQRNDDPEWISGHKNRAAK